MTSFLMKTASVVRKVVTYRPHVVLHVSYTEESRIKSVLWLIEQVLELELKLSGLDTDSGLYCVSLNLLTLQLLFL